MCTGDDEQGSEDDGNVILEDPKGMTLQEVELMTANTSNEDLSTHDEVTLDAKCVRQFNLFIIRLHFVTILK